MVALTRTNAGEDRNGVFQALAHTRRRAVLRILGRISHARPDELATHLVAAESDSALHDVTPSETERAQAALTHVHLPKLLEADLVKRDNEVITPTRHPALHDPTVTAMIEADSPDWDGVLECLAVRRRRIVLTVLTQNGKRMDRTDLAVAVAAAIQSDSEDPVTVDDVLLDLHHAHIPKLDAAGLVAYDVASEMVTYEGHSALDEEWLVADANDLARAVLPKADQPADN